MLSLRPVLMLVIVAASVGSMLAQDIHFSQFGNAPLNLNPGLGGIFGGDLRFVANFRSQWHSVRVPYTTYSGSVENKWYYKRGEYDRYFTGGLLLNVDKQGSLELTSLQIGIPLGITIPVAKNNFLSLGVTPAFGQRSFNSDDWSFDAQFVDCLYQPNAPTMEDGSLFSTNLKYFDLSTGLNYRFYAPKSRTRFDLGGALFHVNRPNHDFWTNTRSVQLAMRKTVYGIGLVEVSPILDILGHVMYEEQGGYREVLYGAGARVMMSTKPYNELAIQAFFSMRHRYTDAAIARLEFFYRTWSLGLSYDINFSDFSIATGHRGGPEISLSYRLYKIKPVDRKCPID